jgi:hypothetical protein
MNRFLAFCLILVLLSPKIYSQEETAEKKVSGICLTQAETGLYKLINEYRAQKGLPAIKLSVALCIVARTHAKDQAENFKDGKRCNMHSWSDKGSWSSCCYTPDHKKAKCMWDKPRELTSYTGDGFEISYFSTFPYPTAQDYAKDILEGWKKSTSHNNIIINKSIWKDMKWKAIGIGIYGDYADVWFGTEEDSTGEPGICE